MSRLNNEGSLYKRKDGRWVSVVSWVDDSGKARRKSVYSKTEKEAKDKMLDLRMALKQGSLQVDTNTTVQELMTLWLGDVESQIRPRTLQFYRLLSEKHIVPFLGARKVLDLKPLHVNDFLRKRMSTGISGRTVGHIRAVLRTAFAFGVKNEIVTKNVVALTDAPKIERKELPPFSTEQAGKLLEAFQGHRLQALFTLGLGLGLRLGELLGLQWENVTLSPDGMGGSLQVKKQLQYINNQYVLSEPKSRTSKRTLSLPGFVAVALAQRKLEQEAEREKAGDAWENHRGLVFTNLMGGPLMENNVRRDFHILLKKNGLPRINLHDLRHFCAALLIGEGIHARLIMEVLGHTQISLTMNTYGSIMAGGTQQAADAMGRLLNTQPKGTR